MSDSVCDMKSRWDNIPLSKRDLKRPALVNLEYLSPWGATATTEACKEPVGKPFLAFQSVGLKLQASFNLYSSLQSRCWASPTTKGGSVAQGPSINPRSTPDTSVNEESFAFEGEARESRSLQPLFERTAHQHHLVKFRPWGHPSPSLSNIKSKETKDKIRIFKFKEVGKL